jgi:hypothetical protein
VLAVLELNALGYLGGTAPGGSRIIYDTHQNALWTGGALIVFLYLVTEVVFRS